MIVDTSALVAILRNEPEARACVTTLVAVKHRRMSAATYLETAALIDSIRDPIVSRRFDELLEVSGLQIEPVTTGQARIAREAYRDFGKGSGHPARLNFGDCFSYALAKDLAEPLLFIGNDFAKTDVISAHP